MDRPHLAVCRKRVLAEIEGVVLEIGIGTGLNIPHYPEGVKKVTTVDPNPGMNRRALKRSAAASLQLEQHLVKGEALPFDDATFDFVVSTWTLCSIRKVDEAMKEIFRVLKPGGEYRFLEHGLSPHEKVQRWQRRLRGVQQFWADGCRLDVDVRALLEKPPFIETRIENYYLEREPRTHGYMYEGYAKK